MARRQERDRETEAVRWIFQWSIVMAGAGAALALRSLFGLAVWLVLGIVTWARRP